MSESPEKKVLVIGDVMLDVWLHGEMTRISPEAPSPVVLVKSQSYTPGGAANVAVGLAALGQPQPLLIGATGHDDNGMLLARLLGMCAIKLVVSKSMVTIQKMRVLSGRQQVLRLDSEMPNVTDMVDCGRVVDAFMEAVTQVPLAAIVVADYAKGVFTYPFARQVVAEAGDRGIPVFVDTKPGRQEWYRGATLLKPNFTEAEQMCEADPALIHPGMAGDAEDQATLMCRHLATTYGYRAVVITRGSQGATCYVEGQDAPFTSSLPPTEVYDVTGAGDTFMAALTDSYLRGVDFPQAVLRANTAAGVAVQHRMTHKVTRRELVAAERKRLGPRGKIMTMEELQEWLGWLRAEKKSIVMTNGCYRVLHHGHIEELRWAASRGDVLVVAVNNDRSVLELKGRTPTIPEHYRAELLAQQDCVDAVVVFDDADATNTVKAVAPNVLVKGGEYQATSVPGAEFVANRGGQVLFAPIIGDRIGKISATRLLEEPP
jgi:D-beta-D-heptose 7-phosphate kinase/D-beta-D-heptose 1-phosphate adenosyltransferase